MSHRIQLITVVVAGVIAVGYCGVTQLVYDRTTNTRCTNVSLTMSTTSALSCGRLCYKENWCKFFNFKTVDQVCQMGYLESWNEAVNVVESGWDLYIKPVSADVCDPLPCLNSGSCISPNTGYYECLCADGWEGTNCERRVTTIGTTSVPVGTTSAPVGTTSAPVTATVSADPCDASPCLNSGSCVSISSTYVCLCAGGWEGTHCEIRVTTIPTTSSLATTPGIIDTTVTSGECESGWSKVLTSCYRIDSLLRNWDDAQTNCNGSNAHLVKIGTAEEQAHMASFLWLPDPRPALWIGGRLDSQTDQFLWTDGVSFDGEFSYFLPDEPDRNGDSCVTFNPDNNYGWADIVCSDLLASLCEYELN